MLSQIATNPKAKDPKVKDRGVSAFNLQDYVQVGMIMSAHGVKGLVRVKSFTEPAENLFSYAPLCDQHGAIHKINLLNKSKDAFVCRLNGLDDRDQVANFQGLALYIAKDQLPPPDEDEFYHADLIGLKAMDANGNEIGVVKSVQNFGAGDLLEIQPSMDTSSEDNQPALSVLIPFTLEYVPLVSLKQGFLELHLDYFKSMQAISAKKPKAMDANGKEKSDKEHSSK